MLHIGDHFQTEDIAIYFYLHSWNDFFGSIHGVMVVLNPVFSSKNLLSIWAHVPDMISYKHNVALTPVKGGLFVLEF